MLTAFVHTPMRASENPERQERVWALHAKGLSVRAIARELRLDPKQVQRCIDRGRQAVRQREADDKTEDLAAEMERWAREDLRDSQEVAEEARAAKEYRSVAAERVARERIRAGLARLRGVDPLRQQQLELKRKQLDLELKRKQLDAGAGLAEHLLAFFGDRPAITPPDEAEPA